MISFGQLEESVRTLYEAESSVRWNSASFLEAANDGLDELSEATKFYERFAPVSLKGMQNYYDLRGFLPEDTVSINAVYNTNPALWLDPIMYRDLLVSRWENVTGEPIAYMLRGLFWMGIYPRPGDDVGLVRVYYSGLAPHFKDASSVLSDLPDDSISALEEYILYDLNCQDGDADKATLHWKAYLKLEKSLADMVKHRITTARVGRMGRR